ncbi:hypothetical protein APHAL10511_007643 [Amanita phalloides]|nr:hypothetical protein APHAL10511_007643 [Amanita phalloides]
MILPVPGTGASSLPVTQTDPLNFKQITFTVTSVSPQSPVRYHIEDEENAVHVFLNRPLSRIDMGTWTEILRKVERPCQPSRFPASAPPSPNFTSTVTAQNTSRPSSLSTPHMKFPTGLLNIFGASSHEPSSSSHAHQKGHDGHRGGKPRQILFYDKSKPHYGFTNFSEHPIKYKSQIYPTSEHLFQSLKFLGRQPYVAELIRHTAKSRDAFDLAHQHQQFARDDWFKVNIQMMDEVLWHKFTQHDNLKRELLATGDAELIEASDQDSFWGWGADRKGRNELGKALMRLRMKLQHHTSS